LSESAHSAPTGGTSSEVSAYPIERRRLVRPLPAHHLHDRDQTWTSAARLDR
jgi:hypothetical protein